MSLPKVRELPPKGKLGLQRAPVSRKSEFSSELGYL
jgi:hypothetical protein